MECADIAPMLIALGVGFGVGGLAMRLLEPFRSTRPRRREAARPLPHGLPLGGPSQDGIEIDPKRLRQLLDHPQDRAGAHN